MRIAQTGRATTNKIMFVILAMLATTMLATTPAFGGTELEVPEIAAQIAADKAEGSYIVMFDADPAIAYDGKVKGLKATKPASGKKLNQNSAAVKKYSAHLVATHDEALAAVGVSSKFYDYTISFNGAAALMTGAQAAQLMQRDDVAMVWKDEIRQLTTDTSDDYLDMPAIWNAVGGIGSAGEDIVVGVIDTGIDPDNASFSEATSLTNAPGNSGKRALAYGPVPAGFTGKCKSGEQWSQDDCTRKIIGAQFFKDGFSNFEINFSGDWLSARDWDGHGSHTASTAAGNVVDATLPNGDVVSISGMAPRARIAAYKACWADAGCASSDLVRAIDQAVADGVDVINYSIGSPTASYTGPDSVAFLYAVRAGVFVATSNGNTGPDANSTGSPASAPWVTSVGAVQHGRNFLGTVDIGDGSNYSGASLNTTAVTGTLVDAAAAGDALCNPGALDAGVVAGNIVLCARGDIARVAKSAAVAEAGGIGMIMYNPTPDSLNADTHFVPSIHVDHIAGPAIEAYIAIEGVDATATIFEGGVLGNIGQDVMAGFSSRGLGRSADIIKPDIIAPGVNVFAAVPGGYDFNSGTSMASPHIAGIGALIKAAHPDWSPTAIKSALMTTAEPTNTLKEDQSTPADALDQGSGLVQPFAALDPGLVYDAGFFDYAAFACGGDSIFNQASCDFLAGLGFSSEASDLNQPNIAIGELAGSQTVTRTVTNVAGGTHTYAVAVTPPPGVSVDVDPATITVGPGESASYTVTFTNVSASAGFTYGSLEWTHGPHTVRSQLAVRPVALAAPSAVSGSGESGAGSFDIQFGVAADYAALASGMVASTSESGVVEDDPANDIDVAIGCWLAGGGLGGTDPAGCGLTSHYITVPAGSTAARFSLFDAYTSGADDLDLYVFDPFLGSAGGSGSGTSAEEVTVINPIPGDYLVLVHGWQTDGPSSSYDLFTWTPGADVGNLTVTSSVTGPVSIGQIATIDYSWAGLSTGDLYMGAIVHDDTSGSPLGYTVVTVDTGF